LAALEAQTYIIRRVQAGAAMRHLVVFVAPWLPFFLLWVLQARIQGAPSLRAAVGMAALGIGSAAVLSIPVRRLCGALPWPSHLGYGFVARHAVVALAFSLAWSSSDLEAAVRSFRAALRERPEWIEATIGIAGAYANLLFLSRDDPPRTRTILAEYVPAMRELAAKGAENPRALWLIGGTELGAPPPWGGDAAKAAATFHRGLVAARREDRETNPPAHVPSWGAAENLMNLAYLHSHSTLEDRALARAYAAGALALVPDWHYVADVLAPQIEALGPGEAARPPSLSSVALRVHRLPAMVAFYAEAVGFRFREVEANGTRSQFGTLAGVELKLVPIREAGEFERFPIHQLGFEVADVGAAVASALRHGGRVQDAPTKDGERVRASVRDPDGNSVELHGPR
jgi:catechol 2,3-dioxygenase-like lactoylglutathione lyase family enzyme